MFFVHRGAATFTQDTSPLAELLWSHGFYFTLFCLFIYSFIFFFWQDSNNRLAPDQNSDVANWNRALITGASFMLAPFCPPPLPRNADSALTPHLLGWDLEWDALKTRLSSNLRLCASGGGQPRPAFHHGCRPRRSPNHREPVAD